MKLIILSGLLLLAAVFAEEEAEEETTAAAAAKPIVRILSFRNEQHVDGSYNFEYESEDGSRRAEQGYYKASDKTLDGRAQVMEGTYSYTDPNGERVSVSYVADENGFRPQGNIIHPAITSYIQTLDIVENFPPEPELKPAAPEE